MHCVSCVPGNVLQKAGPTCCDLSPQKYSTTFLFVQIIIRKKTVPRTFIETKHVTRVHLVVHAIMTCNPRSRRKKHVSFIPFVIRYFICILFKRVIFVFIHSFWGEVSCRRTSGPDSNTRARTRERRRR